MKTLLVLAVVLGLVCMAGGGALMVRGHPPVQQVILQPTETRVIERAAEPIGPVVSHVREARRVASHKSAAAKHKRQPGDDSADALNRRQLRAAE